MDGLLVNIIGIDNHFFYKQHLSIDTKNQTQEITNITKCLDIWNHLVDCSNNEVECIKSFMCEESWFEVIGV